MITKKERVKTVATEKKLKTKSIEEKERINIMILSQYYIQFGINQIIKWQKKGNKISL